MSFEAIRAALDTRLASLPDWPAARIAWPNIPYTPLAGETYLEPTFGAAEPRQAEIGTSGRNRQAGFYRVRIVTPAGQGLGGATRLADEICAHFPRGLDLAAGSFAVTIARGWAAPAFSRESWFILPVTITWDAFTPPF